MNPKLIAEKLRHPGPLKDHVLHWPRPGAVQRIRQRLQKAMLRLPAGFPLP